MNVLAIAGSLRQGSCNGLLLRAAVYCAPADLTMRVYEELAAIPLFNEDLEHAPPESVRELQRLVRGSDGVLFATPEYNQSIPGVLKNAIDWLSRPPEEVLSGKAVAVIGAATGRWGTRLGRTLLVAAVALGDTTALTVSLFGIGALLATSTFWFAVVKWAGALLPGLSRASMFRGRAMRRAPNGVAVDRARLFGSMCAVTALNPEGVVFHVGFLPSSIRRKTRRCKS